MLKSYYLNPIYGIVRAFAKGVEKGLSG